MFSKEPAVVLGALAEVVKAIIPTLIIFQIIHWTDVQTAQMMLLVGVVVGALNIVMTRAQTYSADSAKTALNMPQGASIDLLNRALAADVSVFPGDSKIDVVTKVEKAEDSK